MQIFAQNNNDLFKQAVLAIRHCGEESKPGNSQINTDGTRYLDMFSAQVTNPCDRWLNIEGRNASPIAAIGETFWVLAGRNDLKFLSRVLPRAANFSDDGQTWRGAYGPRIYANGQLDSVINRLRKNNDTRQAYLTIYDPELDSDPGLAATSLTGDPVTKDMICNLALLFDIKAGELNMTVINRSQDVLWGMSSINFIEFSILQEIVAKMIGVNVGFYRLFSNNVHYYNNDVSQKQLAKVTGDTEVHIDHACLPLQFDTDKVYDQTSLTLLFSDLLYVVSECEWGVVEKLLKKYDAHHGLLWDMSYALHCRLNNTLIEPNLMRSASLMRAIWASPIDKKYMEQQV